MVSSSAVVVWKRSEIISRTVGDDERSVSEPVGQLLMSIALGKVELLELISEAL